MIHVSFCRYVFSGMGSQWVGMGKDLMVIDVFRDTIDHMHDVLKEEDDAMDLKGIILDGKEELLESTTNSFSAIASIHVSTTRHIFVHYCRKWVSSGK